MNADNQSRRYLRDNVADDLAKEIDILLDRILSLETKVDWAISHIREETHNRVKLGREALTKLEEALDILRREVPDQTNAIMLLIAAAADIQAAQREIRKGLSILLGNMDNGS